MPIVCALDKGPKRAGSGPRGSQAGGKEHLLVSETLEVREVRGQSPGLVWAEWQEEMKLEPSPEEEVRLITERGKDHPPRQKVKCAQATSFLSRGFCEHEAVLCVCVCVCVCVCKGAYEEWGAVCVE